MSSCANVHLAESVERVYLSPSLRNINVNLIIIGIYDEKISICSMKKLIPLNKKEFSSKINIVNKISIVVHEVWIIA